MVLLFHKSIKTFEKLDFNSFIAICKISGSRFNDIHIVHDDMAKIFFCTTAYWSDCKLETDPF
jgi:hypothetical protein